MKKAFTLIELLAVIIILAIVALIATPIILDVIEESERSANLSQAYLLLSGAENLYTTSQLTGEFITDFDGKEDMYVNIDTTGEKPPIGKITITKAGKIDFAVYIDGACYRKGLDDDVITPTYNVEASTCTLNTGGVTPPVEEEYVCDENNQLINLPIAISDALTPVKIDADGNLTKVSTTNTNGEWHNYCESNWANAVILNDGVTKNEGDSINIETEVKQMYVYIPRYEYEVFASSEPRTINVKFQSVTEITGADIDLSTSPATFNSTDTWITHPAFYYEENGHRVDLPGIWVGKFENGFKNGEDENTTNVEYVIKPNLNSVHSTNIATMYDKINDASVPNQIDVHMLKNNEWGAVAYLSQSRYGICPATGDCTDIKIQNNNYVNALSEIMDIVTGCGGEETEAISTNTGIDICPTDYRWNTTNGIKTSTTHNITGIYDMAAGRLDTVMGTTQIEDGYSGFTSANIPDNKYYNNYVDSSELLGDATIEVSRWNGDSNDLPAKGGVCSWFGRGNLAQYNFPAGIFAYSCVWGDAGTSITTRSSIWIVQ